MPDVIKRLKYFNGQFLRQPDFTDEQDYHLDRQRRHNRQLHTPGIAEGLAVTEPNATSVSVSPGTAIDGLGRQIVLNETRLVGFPSSLNSQTALVVISYAEEESDPATTGEVRPTRWKEQPRVEAILDPGTPLDSDRIALVRLQISSGGTITNRDFSVRTPVGARLHPEATIERLRLSRPGVADSSQWPVLTSGAANRADLAGSLAVTGSITAASVAATGNITAASLNVSGNIDVVGTVDGRDVSADGTKLDNLALSKIEGVSNPGGNIDIVGSGGITVTGNDVANTITIAGNAPSSIDGVSHPGGNIDFVGQNGISITPDNTGKLIAFSTSPAAIGALAAGDYLKRSLTYTTFGPGDADGATRTIYLDFAPKQIWVNGKAWAQLVDPYPYPVEEGYYGGVTGGLCRVEGPGSYLQYGFASHIRRFTMTNNAFSNTYSWSMHQYYMSGVSGFYCADRHSNPQRRVSLRAYISSVGTQSFVLTFRRDHEGYAQPFYFFMELDIITLG